MAAGRWRVCSSTGAETGQGQASHCFAAESHHPTYPHFCDSNLPPAVVHEDISKAAATKPTSVFAQHRGAVTKGKFLLTHKDATNHATIEELRGHAGK